MFSLNGFKKIAQDNDSVTMKHDAGHEIRVSLKGLGSAIQREQLKRLPMAEGGIIETAKSLSRKVDKSEKGVHKPSKADPKGGTSVAGEYSQFAKPGSPMDGRPEAKRLHKQVLSEIKSNPKPHGEYAEGGDVEAPSEDTPPATQPVAPVIPAQAPVQGLQENPALLESAKGTSTVEGAAGTQSKAAALNEQAENNKAKIAQAGAQQAFQVAQFRQKAAEAAQFENQQSMQDLGQRAQAATDYINTHPVDRNQIFKEMGVGGKIATSLGLLFGGFKSGFSGGNNPAAVDTDQRRQGDRR